MEIGIQGEIVVTAEFLNYRIQNATASTYFVCVIKVHSPLNL